MPISRVTNPVPLVGIKVNYFLDRIDHFTNYAGWQWKLEFESPTSLLEKILFRLRVDTKYRLEYLDNYFANDFFTTEIYWNDYETYPKVKEIVTKYNSLGKSPEGKKEKIKLIDSLLFQNNLSTLLRDLHHKMPKDVMEGVIHQCLCDHSLYEFVTGTTINHADFFKDAAQKMASEYIFRGFSRNEISEIIGKVFSKDMADFPFPVNAKTKKQKKEYLEKGTLENQLSGFTHAFNLPKSEGRIIIKVFGGTFPDDFHFQYDKVIFLGKEHPHIRKIKEGLTNDQCNSFFNEEEFILALVPVSWYSQESLLRKAKQLVRKELSYMSLVLEKEFSVDNTNNFVGVNKKMQARGLAWSTKKFSQPISQITLEKLNDNPYYVLKKIKSDAATWFLACESIYVTANKTESIADYWLYLETLLSYNRVEKNIKDTVSSILLINEKFIQDRRILSTINNSFMPLTRGYSMLNLTNERRRKIFSDISKRKIAKEFRDVNYPFIEELIKEFDEGVSPAQYHKAKKYYSRMLIEAYEFRNFTIHKGVENIPAKEKLLATLPNLVTRMRWALLDSLKNENLNTPFDLLVGQLKEKGEAFLKQND